MKNIKINTLQNYDDWLNKAKHEFSLYSQTRGVYELANCFLTLNCLPEWISKSGHAPQELKNIAENKIRIMKGDKNQFLLDPEKLDQIDHQLRLIRVFCNHTKHGDKKQAIVEITMSATFPLQFPITFDHLRVDSKNIHIDPIIESVIDFWEKSIKHT